MLWGDGFEIETIINIRVAKAGLRIAEVPSHEANRMYGASNLHAVRDGFRVLKAIRKERSQLCRPPAASGTGRARGRPIDSAPTSKLVELHGSVEGRHATELIELADATVTDLRVIRPRPGRHRPGSIVPVPAAPARIVASRRPATARPGA